MMDGLNIVIEGPDGSGKSTVVKKLSKHFGFLATKHPGETELGKEIRRIVKHSDYHIDNYTEQVLMAADLCDFTTSILKPNIENGKTVISDRSNLISGFIYAMAGGVTSEQIRKFQEVVLALNPPKMHLIVLHADYEKLVSRQHHDIIDGKEVRCKFQDRNNKFHIAVNEGYRNLILCNRKNSDDVLPFNIIDIYHMVAQYVETYDEHVLSIWDVDASLNEDEVFSKMKEIVEKLLIFSGQL